MGKFAGLKGPGPFLIIPILESVSTYIDQRVRVSAFKAEQTLTKDTVPVNVDAVVYWTVWDVEKAALEVQDYQTAIEHIAQTGLRESNPARKELGAKLAQVIPPRKNSWRTVRKQSREKKIECERCEINSASKELRANSAPAKEIKKYSERTVRF